MAERDAGLGHGWAHTIGSEIEVRRRRLRLWNEQGVSIGDEVVGSSGLLLEERTFDGR